MEILVAVFAGVTAVANIASAIAAYRQYHRMNRTGRINNYTDAHEGYNMQDLLQQVPYTSYKHLLGAQAPHYQIAGQGPRFDHASGYGYGGGAPTYFRTPSAAHVQFRLGGNLLLVDEQQAPDTHQDRRCGLQTGRDPNFNIAHAEAHWMEFQLQSGQVRTSTIAVVNWTAQMITMYTYTQYPFEMYFRNYHVTNCDVLAFARENQGRIEFSGIMEKTFVTGTRAGSRDALLNSPFKLVEDDGICDVQSSNCWSLLGVKGEARGERMFVEMMRAAVFGLIQCRFDNPTLLNVDMVGSDGFESVHVDSHVDPRQLQYKPDCCFSVFSFNTGGWSEQRVLVG